MVEGSLVAVSVVVDIPCTLRLLGSLAEGHRILGDARLRGGLGWLLDGLLCDGRVCAGC